MEISFKKFSHILCQIVSWDNVILKSVFTNHILVKKTYFANHIEWINYKIIIKIIKSLWFQEHKNNFSSRNAKKHVLNVWQKHTFKKKIEQGKQRHNDNFVWNVKQLSRVLMISFSEKLWKILKKLSVTGLS